jgi:adenine-specific DNA-methyltransferase
MDNNLSHLRSVVGVLTQRIGPAERVPFAQAFISHALAAYWKCCLPDAPPLDAPDGAYQLDGVAEAEATRLGRRFSRVERSMAAYLLSTLYTLLLPDDLRAERGMFFTPPLLAETLLDLVEDAGADWCEHSVLDPAAGGGAFVTPVAIRVAMARLDQNEAPQAVIEHLVSHVAGVELDPFSGWMAHVFLETALWDLCVAAGTRLPRLVLSGDSLRRDFGERYDLVIGNPPFGRVKLEPELRRRFARSLYGHANLYGVFMDLAVQLCRPGGVIGYITPASFLGGQYFKNLRALLSAEAPPNMIHFIADRGNVFDQVLQETVLVALKRGCEQREVSVLTTTTVAGAQACESITSGRFPLPSDPHAPWILPRKDEDVALLHALAAMPYRLSHHGMAVSTGPLVWNRHKAQLATHPGADRHPLVWAESVLPSGEFRFSASKRRHQPYFAIAPGQTHLLTTESVVLVQRTTAKEQNRRLIAALLPHEFVQAHGGVVVENHLNVIYPANGRSSISLRVTAALLNSKVVDRIFRCINGSVAVSAFELESLPLPAPEVMNELESMLERGANHAAIERFLDAAYRAGAAEVAA